MADDQTLQSSDIDIDRLKQFFIEMNVKNHCLACGHHLLGINLGNAANEISALAVIRNGDIVEDEITPIIVLSCLRCGCIRAHAYGNYQRWLNEQPKP